MHIETPDGWSLDAERVSLNSWELSFNAWVTNPLSFVVAHGRGQIENRATTAAIIDLRFNCSDAADMIEPLLTACRAEGMNPPGRRSAPKPEDGPCPRRRKTDRAATVPTA